jgi:hypothetical protein
MRLGLGIGVPYGSGALNPDRLSLNLQFAADKTLTARRGPTPTFTRATSATFVGSNGLIQSAAINEARFDHDPVTLACKGLLIEESRTNLALQSETFPLPTWVKTNVTTSPNALVSPSGTETADTLVEDTNTSFHYISQQFAKAASSLTYSFSIYYKNASGTRTVAVALTNGTTSGKAAIFTTSGTITATNVNIGGGAGFTFVSASVESVGSGWYRASIVVTSDTSTRLDAVVYLNNSTTVISSYTGNLSSVYLWGAQVELGSFPTSYIPTTTAAVVRSADVCSITGSNFTGFYNQSEGTMLANAFTPASGDRTVLAADDDTANEMIRLRTEGTNPFFKVTDGGSDVVAIDAGTVTANTAFKLIGAYKVNDFASSVNGGSAVTDTAGTIPTVDRMRIGAGQGGNTMCGCISAIRYFKKRLPDAKLQSLTT